MCTAANTLVIWKPCDNYGTSLQNVSPLAVKGSNNPDPNFFQQGLAFVTSAHLPDVWKSYQKAQLSQEGAAEALYGEGSSSDEIFD